MNAIVNAALQAVGRIVAEFQVRRVRWIVRCVGMDIGLPVLEIRASQRLAEVCYRQRGDLKLAIHRGIHCLHQLADRERRH